MCTCILCTYCTHICLWAEMHPPSIKYLRHLSSLSGKFRVPRLFLSLTWCSQWFSMDTWNYITPPRNMGSHYVKTSCFPIFNQGIHPTIPSVLSERYLEGSSTKTARLSIATVDVSRIAAELKTWSWGSHFWGMWCENIEQYWTETWGRLGYIRDELYTLVFFHWIVLRWLFQGFLRLQNLTIVSIVQWNWPILS